MTDDPRNPSDLADVVDAFRITWALVDAIEREDDEARLAIVTACDDWVLMTGWHVVAKRLRDVLEHHAQHPGCDCGSLEWLESERLNLATLTDGKD